MIVLFIFISLYEPPYLSQSIVLVMQGLLLQAGLRCTKPYLLAVVLLSKCRNLLYFIRVIYSHQQCDDAPVASSCNIG